MKQVAMVSSSPRLLRGKSLNRSRRRSRSRAGRRSTTQEEGGGEPTSPKVTCIGQIRIRRSNNRNTESKSIDLCQCLKRAFVWRRKESCRFFSCWRKERVEEKSSQLEVRRDFLETGTKSDDGDRKEGDYEESDKLTASAAVPIPPKNALILMRCRSAPHNRSSALSLSRFPISPVPASESDEDEDETKGRESDCNVSSTVDKDEEEKMCSSPNLEVPVGLMRCKSEPAKRAEKMMEVSSCKISVSEERGMQMHLPSSTESRHISSS